MPTRLTLTSITPFGSPVSRGTETPQGQRAQSDRITTKPPRGATSVCRYPVALRASLIDSVDTRKTHVNF